MAEFYRFLQVVQMISGALTSIFLLIAVLFLGRIIWHAGSFVQWYSFQKFKAETFWKKY